VTLKLFFTTDVHGSDRCFRKFLNAAKHYDAQAIILGGDMTGKAVVPVVKGAAGTFSAEFSAHPREVTQEGLEELLQEIRFNGLYPYLTDPDELETIHADPDGGPKLFHRVIQQSLRDWMALAEERLRPLGIKVYISPGNDDDPVVDEVLNESRFVINPEERVVEVAPGIPMLSFGFSNPTPWDSPRELPEEEIGRRLTALADQMPEGYLTIYNIHIPPLDTPIDQAAKLDANLKPVVEGGQVAMIGVGSSSVRDLIMSRQPSLGLHGHVHEASGAIRLGRTICINPGSEYSDGVLRGALITVDEKKKKFSYQLTMG
jgi:Icc-related predicted phosphoesterase